MSVPPTELPMDAPLRLSLTLPQCLKTLERIALIFKIMVLLIANIDPPFYWCLLAEVSEINAN